MLMKQLLISEQIVKKISSEAIEAELEKIARSKLDIETLKTRNSDRLDFHDCSVWSIKNALKAAYELGAASCSKSGK
jgi:hypothetical protein